MIILYGNPNKVRLILTLQLQSTKAGPKWCQGNFSLIIYPCKMKFMHDSQSFYYSMGESTNYEFSGFTLELYNTQN